MKKLAIVCVLALFATASVSAGNNLPLIKFGAKAGMTVEKNNLNWDGAPAAVKDALNDASTGWHAGLVGRVNIPLLPIFAQAEVLYNWNKVSATEGASVKYNYFSAPVMAGVGFGLGDMLRLRVNLGPVFNFANNVKLKAGELNLDGISGAISDSFEKTPVTWTAGVGVDLFGLMVDARYNGAFKKNKASVANIRTKPTSWSVSVGYLF